jgi:hypothetical protein
LWLLKIVRPAAARAASAAGADPTTAMSLVNIDAYSVHRSAAFRSYFRTAQDEEDDNDLSNNLIEFIPSCCTSKLQVADYALNAPFKRRLRWQYTSFLSEQVERQLRAGVQPGNIELKHDMAFVAPLFLGWIMNAWEHIQNVNVLKAMQDIGYAKCFDDKDFRKRGAKLLLTGAVPDDPVAEEPQDVVQPCTPDSEADNDAEQGEFFESEIRSA